jgi:hypothetical protein
MGASGTTTLNFGAFPGASDTSVAVTGQASIIAGSLVEAWISPAADTADHSVDEQRVEQIKVNAGNIVAGTGFTIYGFSLCDTPEPVTARSRVSMLAEPRIYGQFNVNWVWN